MNDYDRTILLCYALSGIILSWLLITAWWHKRRLTRQIEQLRQHHTGS